MVQIFDANGKIVYQNILTLADEFESLGLPLVAWPAGIYYLLAQDVGAQSRQTLMFTIEK